MMAILSPIQDVGETLYYWIPIFALFWNARLEGQLCSNGFEITCLIPFGILSFKLTLEKPKDRAGKGDAWYAVVDRMLPACPAGLLLPQNSVSRADGHRAVRSRETG
jgi:hypothetical protein